MGDVMPRFWVRYCADVSDACRFITNADKPLKRYETTRVTYIRTVTDPKAWHYIPTKQNPADIGTRPITAEKLQKSEWLSGPAFLHANPLELPTESPHPLPENVYLTKPASTTPKSYFKENDRHATEEVTNGTLWKQKRDEIADGQPSENDRTADLELQRRMQKEAWPKDMQSIDHAPARERVW